jgi:hypothetical protein
MGTTMSEIRVVIKNFDVVDGKIQMKPESETNYPMWNQSIGRINDDFIPYFTIYTTYMKSNPKNTTFITE